MHNKGDARSCLGMVEKSFHVYHVKMTKFGGNMRLCMHARVYAHVCVQRI